MRFKLLPDAKRYLDSLDKETVKQIYEALRKITKEPPIGDVKKLQGYENLYRLRLGGLMIIFEKKANHIIVEKIAPRGQAYK
ncbi:MAG: type II toxin-antitoxin system RelE/ParE family toxin [Oscillospiraceae bacterium]|nr:type II toxin-antitoxin system RelE/ParE family toxin [Oscillospiraceae bacterium]